MDTNENNHFRGLHIVAFDPAHGNVEVAKVFDTYESSHKLDSMISNNLIPEGHIVAVACKDDCTKNLSY